MTVEILNSDKIKICLNGYETDKYFGNCEVTDYNDIKTKYALHNILRVALPTIDFLDGYKSAEIEFYPSADGGCIICLTRVNNGKTLCKSSNLCKSFILQFDNSENMLSAIEQLYINKDTRFIKSSLYKLSNTYRLVLLAQQQNIEFVKHITDYCSKSFTGIADISYTDEYGMAIVSKNAVSKIGKFLVKDF